VPKKKRKNPFGLSNRLYKQAKRAALEARVPLSTYIRRHNLDRLEAGIHTRYSHEATARSQPRTSAKRNPKEISTPLGGQPGWRRRK
jgi:hypothetical protein